MVQFLLYRPVAVTLTFIAFMILGIVAARLLPVSLMPDVDIPKITVQVSSKNMSARELENGVTKNLRTQLMTLTQLTDINSETRDGSAIIKLTFEHGTNIDHAFIDVNEKIDRSMGSLPRSIERPRVIKASATDIPAFYLNLTLKNDQLLNDRDNDIFPVSQKFVELSSFTRQVIRKRIEQLPEVAIADISGQVFSELLILPDMPVLEAIGMPLSTIENTVRQNDFDLGNLLVRDGQFQYNIRFDNSLQTKTNIENIYFKYHGKMLQLKNVAKVIEHPQKRKGLVTSDGKDALTMAIIKQSDAKMDDLKSGLHDLIEQFRRDYPDIEFTINRDQTQLLEFSIQNLKQSLLIGASLAFIVMFFFLKDFKSPLLIGITMPISLIISLLFFYLGGISINIISLSGLVLGIGMIIDNSIIVIDNITQFRERNTELSLACIKGTSEVFRPMLSSVLTTCAVFIPLIYIGGITGALFYDQAIAVTIGQFVSLFVAVTIVPVYYRIIYKRNETKEPTGLLARINKLNYEKFYHNGFHFTMKNQRVVWLLIVLMLVGGIFLFKSLPKTKLPQLTKSETTLRIDWNDQINIDENKRRVHEIIKQVDGKLRQNTCLIGEQQFLLDINSTATSSEALIYLKAISPADLDSSYVQIGKWLRSNYSHAVFNFEEVGSIFDVLFRDDEPTLMLRLRATKDFGIEKNNNLQSIVQNLQEGLPNCYVPPITWQEQLELKADPALLTLYDVSFDQVHGALKRALRESEIMLLTANQDFVPVVLGDNQRNISEIVYNTTVINGNGNPINLSNILNEETGRDLKAIIGGKEGEYYPIPLEIMPDSVSPTLNQIKQILASDGRFEANFTGTYFSNQELIKVMAYILCISLLMLYFILASQFESLILPVIVLTEIPLAIFAVFLFLKLFGEGINLMSLIGIVVMSGIVINDSILKVDTINQLRSEGYPLLKALTVAGQRRLKPILMTSLTAILALLPFLFTKGMESDLQRPLSLAIIGGMSVGTLISLYFIPLLYYYLKKNTGKQ